MSDKTRQVRTRRWIDVTDVSADEPQAGCADVDKLFQVQPGGTESDSTGTTTTAELGRGTAVT